MAGGVFTEAASISEETLNLPERLYVRLADATGRRVEVELDMTPRISKTDRGLFRQEHAIPNGRRRLRRIGDKKSRLALWTSRAIWS